jgi:Transglutaminase-like superfamily/EF hand
MGTQRYAELGHALEPLPPGPLLPYPPIYRETPDVIPVGGAYEPLSRYFPPLALARWRWSGHPELFDLLDANADGCVDEYELARGLGRGLLVLRDEAAGPLDVHGWEGAREAFRVVDADGDGRVSRAEIARALGPHAVRLAHGHPAHGPALPDGTAYGWNGVARTVVFKNREEKARYMIAAAEADALDPQVVSWAHQFLALPEEERAPAILLFVQNCIRYERDPAWFDKAGVRHGIELLDSAATGFFRAYGDCDLKARMFVALCLACGVKARISPVFRGANGFPHVRAEVLRIDGEASDPAGWDVADPTIVNSSIGRLPRGKALTAWPGGQPPGLAA